MVEYIKVSVKGGGDIEIALMSQFPFDSFQIFDIGFDAYIPTDLFDEKVYAKTFNLLKERGLSFTSSSLENKNWNKDWEKNYSPIKIDDFVGIRANFHSKIKEVTHDLIITPKMAFGTGHHETTFLMVKKMGAINFLNKEVLDYGCGTGVLAILASFLGAHTIDAIDIEEASYLNTIENCEENNVDNVSAIMGEINLVENKKYDIVLANINKNVLLSSGDFLEKNVKQGGILLLSGLLTHDFDVILEVYKRHNFSFVSKQVKGDWISILFKK